MGHSIKIWVNWLAGRKLDTSIADSLKGGSTEICESMGKPCREVVRIFYIGMLPLQAGKGRGGRGLSFLPSASPSSLAYDQAVRYSSSKARRTDESLRR